MPSSNTSAPSLTVRTPDGRTLTFTTTFHIGRLEDNDVPIDEPHVSRTHLVVAFADDEWWVRDLHSRNGLLVAGQRVEDAAVGDALTIQLGEGGPVVELACTQDNASWDWLRPPTSMDAPGHHPRLASPLPAPVDSDAFTSAEDAWPTEGSQGATASPVLDAARYFGPTADDDVIGERTMMIRQAFQQIQRGQRRKYVAIVTMVAAAGLAAATYGYFGYRQSQDQSRAAQELFYAMKTLDVEVANVERLVSASGNADAATRVAAAVAHRREIERDYDQFRLSARLDRRLSEQDRLILRVTRLFGECDVAAPAGYVAEVSAYIRKWQTSDRYARAVSVAEQNGYTTRIAQELLTQHLPPQFFYLAMQESNFDPYISGPPTAKGIAKGMWQFIPETAQKYGLRLGPLVDLRRPDPSDERHHWDLSTVAATHYIKDIYSTDAQASGLLVMASYNWGEDKVVNLLRSMPANPRERNFWQLLAKHRDQVPAETYDYVFYIVSAAVIGENPRLFGFDFDSPLAFLEQH